MKNFLFILIFILIFCGGAFAQLDKNSSCPTIDVVSPAGITQPGETATFTANLGKEAEKLNLEYKWTISGGEILKDKEL